MHTNRKYSDNSLPEYTEWLAYCASEKNTYGNTVQDYEREAFLRGCSWDITVWIITEMNGQPSTPEKEAEAATVSEMKTTAIHTISARRGFDY